MNKKTILFLTLSIGLILISEGQSLEEINTARNRTTKTGMMVLGGWAIANIISAPIAASMTSGPNKYFHQMNGYWNLINLGLAGSGFYNTLKFNAASLSLTEALAEQVQLEKLLLFNAGLDVAYVLGGLYLIERSRRGESRSDMYKGFGRSIILQGSFLFLFDLGFYAFVHQHQADLSTFLTGLSISPTGFAYRLVF